jgi:hypothetical protein
MKFDVKVDHAGFKGTAKLEFPTREEKMKLLGDLKELGWGKDSEDDETVTESKLKLAAKMGEVVEQRLLELDVTHTESGTHINDKAMLDIYTEGQILSGALASILLGGVPLGKAKS